MMQGWKMQRCMQMIGCQLSALRYGLPFSGPVFSSYCFCGPSFFGPANSALIVLGLWLKVILGSHS